MGRQYCFASDGKQRVSPLLPCWLRFHRLRSDSFQPSRRWELAGRFGDAEAPPVSGRGTRKLEGGGTSWRSGKVLTGRARLLRAAMAKNTKQTPLYNKSGINELQMARFSEAPRMSRRATFTRLTGGWRPPQQLGVVIF